MRVERWLADATTKLEQAGVGTARLDALVLLEDVVGRDRAWLLAHPEAEIDTAQTAKLNKLLKRRADHEPLAYVRGRTEFYGREFIITPAVLEPRPESETMVDMLLDLPNLGTRPVIADVGTGSGALGITAKLELPGAQVELLDIDPAALKVAKFNVDKFTLGVNVIKSDLLATTTANYNVLLCNLPYVPDSFKINQAATHEPRLAIFGGPEGLDVYRKLFRQLKDLPKRPLYLLLEALPPQHDDLVKIASAAGYKLAKKNDFILQLIRTQ